MELPRAIKSEQAILGSIIAYPNNVVKVVDLLKAEDFYHIKNIKIYREIKSLYGEGLVIDISTLAQTLLSKGVLQEVGGVTYLSELSTGATYSENIEYHYGDYIGIKIIIKEILVL